jgi:starch synthase (maltosyl-transferring)
MAITPITPVPDLAGEGIKVMQEDGRKRVVIDCVGPQVDGGRFPIKRAAGETVRVVAHAFADGHDQIGVELLFRKGKCERWTVRPMACEVNDEWFGSFRVTELGQYVYTVRAWADAFGTWRSDLQKKLEARQDVLMELKIGSALLRQTAETADPADVGKLTDWAAAFENLADSSRAVNPSSRILEVALGPELAEIMQKYPDRAFSVTCDSELSVLVDRGKAVFSTWYEMFPRSCGAPGTHGTFRDCEKLLPAIAALGFDVLYLPPIHPIGLTNRKGRNNSMGVGPNDPGSPWAIGSSAGGHKAIHPQLGSSEDFQHLVRTTASPAGSGSRWTASGLTDTRPSWRTTC